MTSLASLGRTLVNVPYRIVAPINELKSRIVEIVRQVFVYLSNAINGARASKCTASSLEDNLKLQVFEQSMNQNALALIRVALSDKNIKNFQCSVFCYLLSFAEMAKRGSETDEAELGNALGISNKNWSSIILRRAKNSIESGSPAIKYDVVALFPEGVNLPDRYDVVTLVAEQGETILMFKTSTEANDLASEWIIEKQKNKTSYTVQYFITCVINPKIVFLTASIFQLQWKNGFQKKKTQIGDFTNSEGKTIKIQMMCQTSQSYRIAFQDNMEILELPFAGDSFSLLIFLPQLARIGFDKKKHIERKAKDSLKIFRDYFDKTNSVEFLKNLNTSFVGKRKITICLPRIDLNFCTACSTASPEEKSLDCDSLFVQQMFGKSNIKLNEKGMGTDSAQYSDTDSEPLEVDLNCLSSHQFFVDSPFAWMIVSKEAHKLSTIFFTGIIENLTSDS